MRFEDSYVGRLRAKVGNDLLKLPGACVLVLDAKGRGLFEKTRGRSDWRLVGGLAEDHESLLQCALREVKEETGLVLSQLKPYGFCDNPDYIGVLPNGHKLHCHTMLFVTRVYEGELRPDEEELEDCRWFSLSDLPDNLNTRTRSFLQAYTRFCTTGEFQLV